MYMVNKKTIKLHRLGVAFLLFFFFAGAVCSQNIAKHYVSSNQPHGTLYYIKPQKGFKSKPLKAELIYDITYLSTSDSVVLNFSFYDIRPDKIRSIALQQQNKVLASDVELIFFNLKKKMWEKRYSAKFEINELCDMYKEAEAPVWILYLEGGDIELSINKRKWKKQSEIVSTIFDLIFYNR